MLGKLMNFIRKLNTENFYFCVVHCPACVVCLLCPPELHAEMIKISNPYLVQIFIMFLDCAF